MSSRKRYEIEFAELAKRCVSRFGGGRRHKRSLCLDNNGQCRAEACPALARARAAAVVDDAPCAKATGKAGAGLRCWVWALDKDRASIAYIITNDGRSWNNQGIFKAPFSEMWVRGGRCHKETHWREFPASEIASRVRALGGDPNAGRA